MSNAGSRRGSRSSVMGRVFPPLLALYLGHFLAAWAPQLTYHGQLPTTLKLHEPFAILRKHSDDSFTGLLMYVLLLKVRLKF